MPSVCRRILVLLAAACLGVAAHVSPALAQGAGDQQYQDPFGNSGTATTPSKPKPQTTPSGSLQPLSPNPQQGGTGSSGSSGSSGSAGSTATQPAPAAAAQGLPNTGADTRVLLVAGVALLLTGFGLRLRSAPERF